MAKIAFIMDHEEGHIIPSFGLAHSLKQRGHEVLYVSILDNEDLVKEQGFKFLPILQHIYPKGFRQQFKHLNVDAQPKNEKKANVWHFDDMVSGLYDSYLKVLQVDLFIVSIFLPTDILMLYYKFKLKLAILTPFLREPGKTPATDCIEHLLNIPLEQGYGFIEILYGLNIKINSFSDLARPLDELSELVVCPKEFEIEAPITNANKHYIGPSIRQTNSSENGYTLYRLPKDRKIIYASLGSQAIRHGNLCDVFFSKMMHVMQQSEMQHMHLILCVGSEYDQNKLGNVPENVSVVGWASQLTILQIASLAIIHGGLGSVKECIYYGVPMFVYPLGYDQPSNARRVEYHNLGITGNIKTMSEETLRSCILQIMNSDEIKLSLKKMQKIFQESEAAESGAKLIERLLIDEKRPAFNNSW